MSTEPCEYTKDLTNYHNDYALRQLLEGFDQFRDVLSIYTRGDMFLSLKRELHGYREAMVARRAELGREPEKVELSGDAYFS